MYRRINILYACQKLRRKAHLPNFSCINRVQSIGRFFIASVFYLRQKIFIILPSNYVYLTVPVLPIAR